MINCKSWYECVYHNEYCQVCEYTNHSPNQQKSRSQTGYMFICGGTVIYWLSTNEFIVAISLNHIETIVIHEES